MTESKQTANRRAEARRRTSPDRIVWTRETAGETHSAWLSDVAASSVAFLTPTRHQPLPGEQIELTFRPQDPSQQYQSVRVVRAAPFDRFFSLIVACSALEEKDTL